MSGSEVDVDDLQPKKELSPGELLLQARLAAGLTQEQVAKELYMTVYKVKALETDDYKRLNSDTFARGYIRAYASLLKIDVVVVLAAYDKLMDELRPQAVVQQHSVVAEPSQRGAWHFLVVIGAFLIGLWLISVWFFDNHSDSRYVVAAGAVSSLPVSQKVEPVLPAAEVRANEVGSANASVSSVGASEVSSSGLVNSDIAVIGSANSAKSLSQMSVASTASVPTQSENSISSNQQSSIASAKKTTLDELSFSFRAESWLEVSDSRGDVLATELQAAGNKIKLVGVAPFDVKLGNAPAVDVQLNGTKIDVIPLMGSNVLIMKIGN